MGFQELLGKVDFWSPDDLRTCLENLHPDDLQLIDIRPLAEYVAQHLPGAVRIPVEDLPQLAKDFDTEKLTIVCCTRGVLSRAAAQVLSRVGFTRVHVLKGGMHAWKWGASNGLPEQSSAPFLCGETATEQALFAWQVEAATCQFYQTMAETLPVPEVAALFAELAVSEEKHKTTLMALWEGLSGQAAAKDFPAGLVMSQTEGMMEGGLSLVDVLAWAARSTPEAILDFAMALELSAYDQYLFLSHNAGDPDSERLFEVMAAEERHHLKTFASLLTRLERRV